ncbi:MAG: diacylglycerol kinase family lipid kinase [Sedimentisphaerales bacterium]|nr:diacylglycerol kinase family lipid kinase [Sedimentisphaerales bacterium]
MGAIKPDDGYIAYIVNPKSGASSGEKLPGWRFEEYLDGRGFDVRVGVTRSLDHACELAGNAGTDPDCAMVVAVGGDGTIREVVHGLVGRDKPLLIVPGGTENLLANELGLDKSLRTLTRTFEAGFTRALDIGSANGKCFTSIAGFGFDGEVVKGVSSNRTGHITYFDYFWPLWRTFWRYEFESMSVEVDGEKIHDGPGLVFVGNISRYALGLNILSRADYSDSLLDICVYKCSNKARLIKHSAVTVFKRHDHFRDVVYRQGKQIMVTCDNPDLPTEIDGDPGPSVPVEINVIPKAVRVMVLEGAKPAGIRAQIFRALR